MKIIVSCSPSFSSSSLPYLSRSGTHHQRGVVGSDLVGGGGEVLLVRGEVKEVKGVGNGEGECSVSSQAAISSRKTSGSRVPA